MLFYTILILSFAKAVVPFVVKIFIQVVEIFMFSTQVKKKSSLKFELEEKLEEQSNFNMMDEFAKYTRLQRKIDSIKDSIQEISETISNKLSMLRTILTWGLHFVISFISLYIILFYKYETVLSYPSHWSGFDILGKIVAFPTGNVGSIGCIFWVVTCQLSVGEISQHIKIA